MSAGAFGFAQWRHAVRLLAGAALVVLSAPAPVRSQEAGATHLVVISGVSGEPRIAESWHSMAMALHAAAISRFGLPAQNVTLLTEDSTRDPARIAGRSTRANVERVLGALARSLKADDRLVVVLFAHGSSLSGATMVNLPGPDMSDADFKRVLAPATAPMVAFIHTGSASGEFATALGGARRIVITATKSAREQNETLFPGYFVRALTTDVGDTDKDGRVSLLEAFTYATHEVEQLFAQGNRLPTEHPQLADGADGGRARSFFLAPAGGASLAANPAAAALLRERAELQASIDGLRARKADMSEEAYQRALEPLMIKLAEASRALRALGGGAKP